MLDNTCDWKESSIFPKDYLVSNDGRVFSVRANREIRPSYDKYGYLYYVLCVNGVRKTVKAHRLVALSFIPNPDNKPTINHINGVRDDNRVANLEWATHKEQKSDPLTKANMDKVYACTDYKAMGAIRDFGRRKVTITWKNGNKANYPSLLSASKDLGINYGHLSEILNGKRNQRKDFCIAVTKERFKDE